MSTAAPGETLTGTPLDELRRNLPEQAQRHLDTLKGAIELRLAALEAALADPSNGGALEELILDLARVATVEAQAAAAKACADTQLVADTQKAKAAAVAQQILQQERAAAAEFRQSLEQAQQKLAKVESDLRAELRLAKESVDAEAARGRAAAAEAERALKAARQETARALEGAARTKSELEQALIALRQDGERALVAARHETDQVRVELDAERAASEELRRSLARAEEHLSDARKDHAQARAAHEEAVADVARARDAVATLQQACDRATAEGDAARAALDEVRRAKSSTEEQLAALQSEHTQSFSALQELRSSLDELRRTQDDLNARLEQERTGRADAERRLAETESTLEQERRRTEAAQGLKATLQQQLDEATMQLQAMGPEHAEARAAHAKLTRDLAQEREKNNDLRAQLSRSEPRIREMEQAGKELERHRQNLERDLDAARVRILSLESEIDAAQGRISRTDGERAGAIERLNEIEAGLRRAPQGPVAQAPSIAPPAIAQAPVPPAASSASAADEAASSAWVPVRLAERFRFPEPLSVPINGDSGLLCDLSVLGCQVVSGSALKPNQKVRVVLPTEVPLTCTGKVMWARLEPSPKGRGFGYRAGVQFVKPPQDALASFIEERRSSTP